MKKKYLPGENCQGKVTNSQELEKGTEMIQTLLAEKISK